MARTRTIFLHNPAGQQRRIEFASVISIRPACGMGGNSVLHYHASNSRFDPGQRFYAAETVQEVTRIVNCGC